MNICYITDKKSPGVLLYIEFLCQEIERLNPNVKIDIKDFACISMKKYDIAHFHISNSTRKVLATLPIFQAKFKLATIHDILPRSKKIPKKVVKINYLYLNRFIDIFIVHSLFAKKLLLNVNPFIQPNKVKIIYHGSPIIEKYDVQSLRRMYGFPEDEQLLLLAGFIKRSKGIIDVIDTFNELNLDKAKLLIVGKIQDNELERILNKYLMNNSNIKYCGYVENSIFLDYIKMSDILINYRLNSVGESSGPMAIAIGAGKPVICSNIGSFPEIAEKIGIIVNSREELKAAIFRMCSDFVLRRKLSIRSRRLGYKLSWRNIAKKHLELYSNLMEGGMT